MPEHAMSQGGGPLGAIFGLIGLAMVVVVIAGMWKVFDKAGQPGWACLVPIYNLVVMLQIAGKPIWWLILFCIPLVNFVAGILVTLSLAKSFGKDVGFAIGLILLGVVFFPILGFDDSTYQGPAG